ncbi:ABC transporter permease [Robiginitalea sp. SC105]|uniref:ABC transporter permease n=1 Tax=Robiginitalea sp. SC105 TaxID=2762332 RepID=UPI001639BB53|nr:ABC transporter permease [Robiginitalea sp. SC105]MBC2839394.1 ABC transporter permease [Robiginitalea sp. SC105]
MIRNYLKIAWRSLMRYKGYTFVKVSGLAVGVSCCLLILLFVRSEWSYDAFHTQSDRLYRAWQDEAFQDQRFINVITPLILGPTLEADIPEVEQTCRVMSLRPIVTLGANRFTEAVLMVDPSFFDLFDFPVLRGNTAAPLAGPGSLVLSESAARKYFGDAGAVGQDLEMDLGDEQRRFTVSAVVADAPQASSIQYEMLISYANAGTLMPQQARDNWFNVNTETYVLLREDATAEAASAKFPAMMRKALGEDYPEGGFDIYLQPITDIHLNNSLPAGNQPVSDPKYSYILASVGLIILLVACANFVLLSVGHSGNRAREVGVRKVLGARRRELIRQFLGEAFLVTCMAVLLGLGLALLLLRPFNNLIVRDLDFPADWGFAGFCLVLTLAVTLLSGFYPALVLSRFNPARVLKGLMAAAGGSALLRKGLVVAQFAASIALIICSVFIGQQIRYFQEKDLGYEREHLIVVPTNMGRQEGIPLAERYRTALLSHPEVANVSVDLYSFAETPWITMGFTDEQNAYQSFQYNLVDPYFVETMKLRIKEGRSFDPQVTSDRAGAAVVNEAFVRQFGLQEPIGQKLPGRFPPRIIGVLEDFNYESLHSPVTPLVLTLQPDSMMRYTENVGMAFSPQPRVTVRLKGGSLVGQVDLLKTAWASVAPDQDFEHTFLDESLAARYQAERRTGTIVKVASALAVFIAVLGLFALVTLTLARRRKEIGIRRVLGAPASSIVRLISMDYARLIGLASLIAIPLAWWFMRSWLRDFAYTIELHWWVFLLGALGALAIALLTIGVQSARTALSNPVNSLRTE